jgi:hypothetical protein
MTIENIRKVISLIDKRLIKQLGKKEMNDEEIDILSSLKSDYTEDLNKQIRISNTREMFKNDKYKKLP